MVGRCLCCCARAAGDSRWRRGGSDSSCTSLPASCLAAGGGGTRPASTRERHVQFNSDRRYQSANLQEHDVFRTDALGGDMGRAIKGARSRVPI